MRYQDRRGGAALAAMMKPKLPKLTDAEKRALKAMAHGNPVRTSTETRPGVGYNAVVHGATARRLEKRKLVKSMHLLADGREVRGIDLARYFGYWSTRFAITRKGLRAIGQLR